MKLPEPTWFQYRWLNPENFTVHESRLQWEDITANWDESVVEQCEEIRAYKYQGKPTYEVRGLYTETQYLQGQRDALEATALLFNQPHKEYFGQEIQDAIRKLMEGL